MARLAKIDLDWLESEIEIVKRAINSKSISTDGKNRMTSELISLNLVRSRCTPIEHLPPKPAQGETL